jgi:SAM-dependent methyltransferase
MSGSASSRSRSTGTRATRTSSTALVENIGYQRTTFEEAELDAASADAVLFFESFHHIIDEHAAVAKCARVLRPGGVVCILGDSNWVPGYREQEAFWVEEMERFGTLESPFTHGYLVALFEHYGFGDVTRHHGVNGLVPVAREQEPVVNFAGHLNATYVNLVTARKRMAS